MKISHSYKIYDFYEENKFNKCSGNDNYEIR